jgi:hypothetical protein
MSYSPLVANEEGRYERYYRENESEEGRGLAGYHDRRWTLSSHFFSLHTVPSLVHCPRDDCPDVSSVSMDGQVQVSLTSPYSSNHIKLHELWNVIYST